VDSLIELADSTENLDQQIVMLRKLQHKILVELPYVPLWYEDHVAVYRNELIGYRLRPDGNYDGLINIIKAEMDSASNGRKSN
jgi:peptide/nickel transport system substrate-binding protein